MFFSRQIYFGRITIYRFRHSRHSLWDAKCVRFIYRILGEWRSTTRHDVNFINPYKINNSRANRCGISISCKFFPRRVFIVRKKSWWTHEQGGRGTTQLSPPTIFETLQELPPGNVSENGERGPTRTSRILFSGLRDVWRIRGISTFPGEKPRNNPFYPRINRKYLRLVSIRSKTPPSSLLLARGMIAMQ